MWKNWELKTNNKGTRQIFENNNEAVYQLLIYFNKACG
jgi:hypothetical protein